MFLKTEDQIAKKYFSDFIGVSSFIKLEDEVLSSQIKALELAHLEVAQSGTTCSRCESRASSIDFRSPLVAFIGSLSDQSGGGAFSGAKGDLIVAAIEKGLKLNLSEVFIYNIGNCEQFNEKAKTPVDINLCAAYLLTHLKSIQPKVVVTLGGLISSSFLGSYTRGDMFEWNGLKVLPSLDLEEVLTQPDSKKIFWGDLKLVMKELGI